MRPIRHALLVLGLAIPVAAHADLAERYRFNGTIGSYPVGVTIAVAADHRSIDSAQYFYASKMTDIPLRAGGDRDTVILQEPGGGVFRLHFVGNGSEHGAPLNFYNSVGLAGTWTGGGKTLPVKLGLKGTVPSPDGRWYRDVTLQSDAAFEATVRRFLHGATTGNIAETASATSFPLRVNGGTKPYRIDNPAQLKAHWAQIFTPRYVARLRLAVPHDMFVRNGEAMIGDGEAWFDAKGAATLNIGLAR